MITARAIEIELEKRFETLPVRVIEVVGEPCSFGIYVDGEMDRIITPPKTDLERPLSEFMAKHLAAVGAMDHPDDEAVFDLGECVFLRSGSPPMTVLVQTGVAVTVGWFRGDKYEEWDFPFWALTSAGE